MMNNSRMWNATYIKTGCSVLEDFLSFPLYSFSCITINSMTVGNILPVGLSCSLNMKFEFSI